MPWMHTNVRPTSIHPTYTSKLAYSFCRMVRLRLEHRIKGTLQSHKTSIPRPTNLHLFMDLRLLSGVLLNHNNRPQVPPHQPSQLPVGTVHWRRSVIPVCLRSS